MSKDSKSDKPQDGPFSLGEIETLLDMLAKHDVSEFELELGEGKISLSRGPRVVHAPAAQAPQFMFANPPVNYGGGYPGYAPQQPPPAAEAATAAAAERAEEQKLQVVPKQAINFKEVSSPMVGTFYRRPAVDAEPYVGVGDVIKKGDVLCIIEAMKLMNEIESDVSGRIAEVCLEDGQMVEYGEVLFRIEPV